MAKSEVTKPQDDDEEAGEGQKPEAEKKRFGKKFLLIAGGGGLALVLALGAGAYIFFFSGSGSTTKMAANPAIPLVAPQVAYYDMPDIVVNIQSADGSPAYLKLGVSLELDTAEEKPGIQVLMPRIVDQFQGYLRELRIDDLRGSAGVVRLKEELLRRINTAAAPYPVRDVLLKELIIQ